MTSLYTNGALHVLKPTISAMRQQEETTYRTQDYLQLQPPSMTTTTMSADAHCRKMMADWYYKIVDFVKLDRETVSCAMNCLDRLLMTPLGTSARSDLKMFQLAAMTCLYTSVKIHETQAMEPKVFCSLSRGAYSAEEIEAMESDLLTALQWRLHPPTSLSFVRHFLYLVPEAILDPFQREAVYNSSKYQTEVAVAEYAFVSVKASTIAFAALRNALQGVVDDSTIETIVDIVSQATGIDTQDSAVVQVQNSLCYYLTVLQQASQQLACKQNIRVRCSQKSNVASAKARVIFEASPRSAAAVSTSSCTY